MKKWIFILVIALLLTGCQSVQGKLTKNGLLDWKYGDLRLLDPIDAIEPDRDLIALYTRINDQSFQIRIDFLDLLSSSRNDIYLAVDTNPGGLTQIEANKNDLIPVKFSWDYLIKIPSTGKAAIINDHLLPVYGMALLIVRDVTQDRMIISFNKNILPISLGATKLQVIITPPNQNVVADQSDLFSIDSPSPPRAKVSFAFWNTFSASTPAQTLRSWAGAHSGPLSSRHGLKYLLDAADQTGSSLLLFDILTPETISAFDYLNALPRFRELTNRGILASPFFGTTAHSDMMDDFENTYLDKLATNNWDINNIWNIKSNVDTKSINRNSDLFMLLNSYSLYVNKDYLFGINDYAHLSNNGNTCSILFFRSNVSTNTTGLSVECKRLLLSSAMSAPPSLLILGGDFSNSVLGDPHISAEVFNYIEEHPWIQILSIYDLMKASNLELYKPLTDYVTQLGLSEQAQHPNTSNKLAFTTEQEKVYEALIHSPKNEITDLAWRIYYSITRPASSDLISLGISYMGQIGELLSAAAWAEKPTPNFSCDIDLDYDGKNECILANYRVFAIVEPEGGYIPFVFSLDDSGIHQVIGPTWEFIVGMSDPSIWDLSLGVRSDSEQILGAFSDSFDSWNYYNISLTNNKVVMTSDNMAMRKSVSILPNSIHVQIHNIDKSSTNSSIPLVVDPWLRYTTPGWGDLYTMITSPSKFLWGINSGESVDIRSTNRITGFSFNATHAALAYPEDPNFDYSRGHYLPFPMALAEINTSEDYSVDIIIYP